MRMARDWETELAKETERAMVKGLLMAKDSAKVTGLVTERDLAKATDWEMALAKLMDSGSAMVQAWGCCSGSADRWG
jgi:hypothetical protein